MNKTTALVIVIFLVGFGVISEAFFVSYILSWFGIAPIIELGESMGELSTSNPMQAAITILSIVGIPYIPKILWALIKKIWEGGE